MQYGKPSGYGTITGLVIAMSGCLHFVQCMMLPPQNHIHKPQNTQLSACKEQGIDLITTLTSTTEKMSLTSCQGPPTDATAKAVVDVRFSGTVTSHCLFPP